MSWGGAAVSTAHPSLVLQQLTTAIGDHVSEVLEIALNMHCEKPQATELNQEILTSALLLT